jgi:hypothetical protein
MKRTTTILLAVIGVLALGGVAGAASRYVITSVHQISPSVLKKLRGARGPQGYPGVQGDQGFDGVAGPQGAPGSAKAWALVGSTGNVVDSTSNVTGISHTAHSGIYCVTVTGVPDLQPAFVSSTDQGSATGVRAVPSHPDCATGTVEVQTFDQTLPSSTTAGTPLSTPLADGGFVLLIP